MLVAHGMSFVCFVVTQVVARYHHRVELRRPENVNFLERDSCKAVKRILIFGLNAFASGRPRVKFK